MTQVHLAESLTVKLGHTDKHLHKSPNECTEIMCASNDSLKRLWVRE